MGCSDSRLNSEDEGSESSRRNSATSWAGPGSLDWHTLFALSNLQNTVERTASGKIRGQLDSIIKVSIPRPEGEKLTRNHGDGLLGIRGNAATADMLSLMEPGELFSDEEFGAKCDSLYYDCSDEIEWKRASQISDQPQMMVKGITPSDVKPGVFQNIWFLQPLAAVSQHHELIRKIIPTAEPLFREDYKGMVSINFWRFGDWVTVYVSDSLPATEENELLFASSEDTDEFWVALVEKAYAKLHGCYEAIEFGNPVNALIDLTGGLVERYRINGLQPLLYHKLARAVTSGSVITCIRKGDWEATYEDLQRIHQEKERLKALEEEEEAERQKQEDDKDENENENDDDDTRSNKSEVNDDDRLSLKSFTDDNATVPIDDVESGIQSSREDAEDATDSVAEQSDELEEVVTTRVEKEEDKCCLCCETGHEALNCPSIRNEDGEDTLVGGTVNEETDEIVQPDMSGLIPGNMYKITDIRRIARVKGTELLVRLKNPWGEGEEWTGPWCDGDYRWDLISKKTRDEINFQEKEDGEFWMNFSDFCKHFNEVMICTIPKEGGRDEDRDEDEGFSDAQYCYGKWTPDYSAGGCRNDIESFATNPQFELQVFESDERDPTVIGHLKDPKPRTCSVVISLMQDYRRTNKEYAIEMLSIGFAIYRLNDDEKRVWTYQMLTEFEVGKSGPHRNTRDVTGRFELQPGRYAIIPSTYAPGDAGRFLLRVHSLKRVTLSELQEYEKEADERNTAIYERTEDKVTEEDEEQESGRGNDSEENEKEDEKEEDKEDERKQDSEPETANSPRASVSSRSPSPTPTGDYYDN